MENHKRETDGGKPWPHHILTDNGDYVLIVGDWKTVEDHVDKFVPSSVNQDTMAELTSLGVEVEYFGHFDLSPGVFNPPEKTQFVVGRYEADRVTKDTEKGLRKVFSVNGLMGGWRVDPPEGEEHFAVLNSQLDSLMPSQQRQWATKLPMAVQGLNYTRGRIGECVGVVSVGSLSDTDLRAFEVMQFNGDSENATAEDA